MQEAVCVVKNHIRSQKAHSVSCIIILFSSLAKWAVNLVIAYGQLNLREFTWVHVGLSYSLYHPILAQGVKKYR